MNSLVTEIWLALALDFLVGDPSWLPHPVRVIGRTAQMLEEPARRMFKNRRLAGIIVAVAVIGGTCFTAWGLLTAARAVSPLIGDIAGVWILYTSFAARDLAAHGRAVFDALAQGDIPKARHAVSRMVGRDTKSLDEAAIVRAAVESVAENTVDGILSPLFFAFLFGPVGAMGYKAVNTLDSTFGYKNERYLHFGWASARIDDAANYIPARLSMVFIPIGAFLSGERTIRALRTSIRDGRGHSSPNSAYPEAGFAGALGIRLGGPLFRNGKISRFPMIGDPVNLPDRRHILRSNTLMFHVTVLFALFMTGVTI